MKVLLMRPKPPAETIGLQHVMICEPLELEYLVSNIPEKIQGQVQVKIIDGILEKRPYEAILREERPDMIGYTGYITHVGVIKELARRAKEWNPKVVTAVGGVHAEVVPEDFASPELDFVFSKNGIDRFNASLEGLLLGKPVAEIQAGFDPGEPKKTTFAYRHPDRASVQPYKNRYYYMFHRPCALIKTSFGCPYECSFCFCKEITDGNYFARDLEDVVAELAEIEEKEIYIVDDDFLFDSARLKTFISLLRERKIEKKYLVYGRADFIAKNKALLKDFKDAGLQAVIVGIESVRAADLESYNKGTTREINERCIQILRELGIELYATLIIPLDFSKEDFKELTSWLRRHEVRFVNLQPLTPMPGTDIFGRYEKDLIVDREDYEQWDMAHVVLKPEHMSIRAFYFCLLKAYYQVIMRPKHVRALIKKYGLGHNWRMLVGSSQVSGQYVRKILRRHEAKKL